MDIVEAAEKLDYEWDFDEGFFGKLRRGVFDKEGLQRVIDILTSVNDKPSEQLDKRFVKVTWFIPTFISWQRESIQKFGGDIQALDHGAQTITEILFKLLGVP